LKTINKNQSGRLSPAFERLPRSCQGGFAGPGGAMLLAEQIIRLASCGRSARTPLIFSQ